MKNIILTFCLCVATVHADPHFLRHTKQLNECLEEYNLSQDDFQQMLVSKDPKAGCIYACSMEKKEEMVDGEIDENKVTTNMHHIARKVGYEAVAKAVSSCKTEADTALNKCEKALKMKTCAQREVWKLNNHRNWKRDQNFQQCLNESNISTEQFREMRKSFDPKVGCIIACSMEKSEELADGKFVLDNIIKNLPQDAVKRIGKNKTYEMLSNCTNEVESVVDKCEKAAKMNDCKNKEFFKVHALHRQHFMLFTACLAQNNIKLNKYEELKRTNDPKVADVLLCIMEKSGEYKDGKIDKEKVLENTPPQHYMKIGKEKYMEIIEVCVTEGEAITNKSEMVVSVKNCIRKRKVDAETKD